jgi:hypothetical protein
MEEMKFGICWVKDSVNSSTFGIVYRKSTQNLYIDKLSSFEPVFNTGFCWFLFEINYFQMLSTNLWSIIRLLVYDFIWSMNLQLTSLYLYNSLASLKWNTCQTCMMGGV